MNGLGGYNAAAGPSALQEPRVTLRHIDDERVDFILEGVDLR